MKAQKFLKMKRAGEKIAMLTAYDAPMAQAFIKGGVDLLLVGDSLGTNILGYASEQDVTMDDMVHHTKAVRRGAPDAYIATDLPYGSIPDAHGAVANALRLVQAGADMVKFEGARPEILQALKGAGLEVCCHLGLEPQNHEEKRLKAKTADDAAKLLADAKNMDALGMDMIVLELIPQELAGAISRAIRAPTIGIGAGPQTDGQVLVAMDALGYGQINFRHNKKFAEVGAAMEQTARAYAQEVRAKKFPTEANAFKMPAAQWEIFTHRNS